MQHKQRLRLMLLQQRKRKHQELLNALMLRKETFRIRRHVRRNKYICDSLKSTASNLNTGLHFRLLTIQTLEIIQRISQT